MSTPDVVTVGEAMALLLAEPGATVADARWFDRSVAGAECNVAVGLARLGHRVAFFGRVGADPLGETVLRTLRAEGLDTSLVHVDSSRPTGLLVRDAPVGRPVSVIYHRAASAGSGLTWDDIDSGVIASSRVLHVTGITAMLSSSAGSAVDAAVSTARRAGTHITLDPNVRLRLAPAEAWRPVIARLAASAATVLVGSDELELLAGDRAAAGWFLDQGASIVVVKDGRHGAWATDGKTTWRAGARVVPEVDPVGAGDAFAAGWLSGHLRDLPVEQRLTEAAVVASCVVAARGDLAGLPSAAVREALMTQDVDVRR